MVTRLMGQCLINQKLFFLMIMFRDYRHLSSQCSEQSGTKNVHLFSFITKDVLATIAELFDFRFYLSQFP